MPKKNSSNTTKPGIQNPAVASWDMRKKSSSKPSLQKPTIIKEKISPGTFGKEIEEIFSKKRKKLEQQNTKKTTKGINPKANKLDKKDSKDYSSENRKKKMKKSGGSNVDMFENEEPVRTNKMKTADGLVIYKEEELGIGKADAGGTRLCPFDCDCCF